MAGPVAVVASAVLAAAGLAGCDAPLELRPDQVLRDSLGLTDRDRVHVVRLSTSDVGVEAASPFEVTVRAGDRVAFQLVDRRTRSVHFDRAGLDAAATGWGDSSGLFRPPLLADSGTRWVLDFTDAPAGRYPYSVVGGGELGGGSIVVEAR